MLDHARDGAIPSQTGRCHLEVALDSFASENGVPLDAVEVGIGPHVDDDVQDADFNDQYFGLELDPVGAAAARQAEIDFALRMKAFEPRPQTDAYQRMGRKPFGMRYRLHQGG